MTMAAMRETFEHKPFKRRAVLIRWRWLGIASVVIIVLVAGVLIAIRPGGPLVERGAIALVDAFRNGRVIEPRLSGGFSGGEYRPSGADGSKIGTAKLEQAGELLRDAIVKGDLSAQLPYARWLLVSGSAKLPEALKYLRLAVASAPENAEAHNDLGVGLIEQGKLEDALEEFETALNRRADMPEALFNRAFCYQRLLLRDAASADYSRLLEIDRDGSWLSEIKQRQQEMSSPLAPQKKVAEIVAAFDAALADGNIDDAKKIEDQNCEIVVKHAYSECATRYSRERLAGNLNGAESALSEIDLIGTYLHETRGDTCLIDFGSYLRGLADAERQNELELINEYAEEVKRSGRHTTDEAQAIFEKLSEKFGECGNDAFRYFSMFYVSVLQYDAGSFGKSIDVLKQAQTIVERNNWDYHRANVLLQLAIAHSRLGRDAVAIKYCEQALKFGHNLWTVQAKALQYMSNAYGHLGEMDKRLSSLRESVSKYLSNVPTLSEIASNYLDIAELYRVRGNHRLAMLYASEALTLSDRAEDKRRAAQASSFAAVEYARLNQFEMTEDFRKRAFDYLDKLEINRRPFATQYVLTRAAEIAEARGDHPGAVKLYSSAKAVLEEAEDKDIPLIRVLRARAEAYARAKEFNKARHDLERAVGLIEGYREKIDERENRSSFLDASQSVFDQMILLNIRAFKRGSEAFKFSEQSRARSLLDEFSEQRNASSIRKQLKPFKLDTVQRALPDDVRLLTYSVTSEGTFLFLITRTGFEVAQSDATAETLDRLVTDYVSSLKDIAPLDEVNEKASTLYRCLIAPIEHQIRDGKTLCIAPDKALHFLPFAALVDPSGQYLIESCDLTYTPSASALALCLAESRAKRASNDEVMAAVGNPYFNRDQFPQLRDLPHAQREAEVSAALYLKSAILTGRDATKDRVNAALKDCDVAHLAVHCLVQEKSPWLAALVLADQQPAAGASGPDPDNESLRNNGLLYLKEVYAMRLPRTRLVVLSACQSGLGQYYRGEGIVSLVRPFLALGVPAVVASLWAVDSEATSALMIDFHQERRTNHRRTGDALRDAQIKMAHSGPHKHPFYWAPFISVGSNN